MEGSTGWREEGPEDDEAGSQKSESANDEVLRSTRANYFYVYLCEIYYEKTLYRAE